MKYDPMPKTKWVINKGGGKISLADRFIVPPFSVLDTRQGYWIERKKMWDTIIGDNAEVRIGGVDGVQKDLAREIRDPKSGRLMDYSGGSSVLDPVLAEIMLHWFCPDGGSTLDPFAGDTAFGFISGFKGYPFTGIDIRQEQVDFNQSRVDSLNLPSRYICDDGCNVLDHVPVGSIDMVFSCPPYFDLTVYSHLPGDASYNKSWDEFVAILGKALGGATKCLKLDRFAVVVCADLRDNKHGGYFYRFPDAIRKIMCDTYGLHYYNDLVLINHVGTRAMQANKFMHTRKTPKTHQNVLVFYKGDIKSIKSNFKEL